MSVRVGWEEDAACRSCSTETIARIFFPATPRPRRGVRPDPYQEARRICGACPVREDCLEDAMRAERGGARHGMFGGLTPLERDQLETTR